MDNDGQFCHKKGQFLMSQRGRHATASQSEVRKVVVVVVAHATRDTFWWDSSENGKSTFNYGVAFMSRKSKRCLLVVDLKWNSISRYQKQKKQRQMITPFVRGQRK